MGNGMNPHVLHCAPKTHCMIATCSVSHFLFPISYFHFLFPISHSWFYHNPLEKARTNFTRDPRHRRHKCLTRNSVTYSVLAMPMRAVSWKLLASVFSARDMDEERGENPG